MACHDKNSTKHLNFLSHHSREPLCDSKIISSFKLSHGENVSHYGKFHNSSLRIPADPSWPKIPQRKFPDSVGDIIDQPCVVTVTGTPGRNRIVRTPNSLNSTKGITSKETADSTMFHSGYVSNLQSMPQLPKRRPGCIDPRFKKVTTVKSQIKSIKPDEQIRENPVEICHSVHVIPNQVKSTPEKVELSIPEKDINVRQTNQQESDKSIETKTQVKEEEVTKVQKDESFCENVKKQQNENSSTREVDETTLKTNGELSPDSRKTLSRKNESSPHKVQESLPEDSTKQFGDSKPSKEKKEVEENKLAKVVIEEKKVPEEKKEMCFSNEKTGLQMRKVQKCVERFKNFMKSPKRNSEDHSEGSVTLSDDEIYRNRCKEHTEDKESFFPATTDSEFAENETFTTLNRKKKILNYYNSAGEESNYSPKDYELIDFFQTHGDFYKFHQISDFPEDKKGKMFSNPNFKQKIKSEQNLSYGVWQNCRNSEPLIPNNQRRCVTSYSKRRSDCSQGKEEITDSEFAFLWPEQQRTRRKSNHYSQKLIDDRRNRSVDLEKKSNSPKFQENNLAFDKNCVPILKNFVQIPKNLQESKKRGCKKSNDEPLQCLIEGEDIQDVNSPRTETDIVSEKPKRIPIKTQKLLSKSYWEYYRNLNRNQKLEDPQKHYFAQAAASQMKKRENVTIYEEQSELSPPEIKTLKRCSVLSSMINSKLDSNPQPADNLYSKPFFTNKVKSSEALDDVYGNQTQSEVLIRTNYESSISSKSEGNKQKESQVEIKLIKLKTIAFFGILMYIIIIFLPMLYDHIFHEDYDDYSDLTYVELVLDYIVSSYREAFSGIIDFVNRVLYRPIALNCS